MFLVYINPLNKNYRGEYLYEFLFSETKIVSPGEDWDVLPASNGSITPPPESQISLVGVFKSSIIELDMVINSEYFSFLDCIDNIVAIAWEREDEKSPRLVFNFGDTLEIVEKKLMDRGKIMEYIKE
jgi:hypothetical protein